MPVTETPDHADRQAALAVRDFGDAGSRADGRFEVFRVGPFRRPAEPDRRDGSGRIDRIMLALPPPQACCRALASAASWR
jgi:hypothetical protein